MIWMRKYALLSRKDQVSQADSHQHTCWFSLPKCPISVSTLIHLVFQDKALLSLWAVLPCQLAGSCQTQGHQADKQSSARRSMCTNGPQFTMWGCQDLLSASGSWTLTWKRSVASWGYPSHPLFNKLDLTPKVNCVALNKSLNPSKSVLFCVKWKYNHLLCLLTRFLGKPNGTIFGDY